MWNHLAGLVSVVFKYSPSLATSLIGGVQLIKDWNAHHRTWRRIVLLALLVIVGIGGTINTYSSSHDNANRQQADQKQIAALQASVEAAKHDQDANTAQFLLSFRDLSDRLGNLQSQVKTTGLEKEANQLRAELEATQKALVVPKAKLEASLGDVQDKGLENLGVKEISSQLQSDGTLSFTALVVNTSSVQAKNGHITLRICKKCEFVEEPTRFNRVTGADSTDREMVATEIPGIAAIAIPLKLKVPAPPATIEVRIAAKCENCEAHEMDVLRVNY